jgi:hypothetical protein
MTTISETPDQVRGFEAYRQVSEAFRQPRAGSADQYRVQIPAETSTLYWLNQHNVRVPLGQGKNRRLTIGTGGARVAGMCRPNRCNFSRFYRKMSRLT